MKGFYKIGDLGSAVVIQKYERRLTACGTFDYTPPEIMNKESYDESIDLWALGVVSYELMVGKLPFYKRSKR